MGEVFVYECISCCSIIPISENKEVEIHTADKRDSSSVASETTRFLLQGVALYS